MLIKVLLLWTRQNLVLQGEDLTDDVEDFLPLGFLTSLDFEHLFEVVELIVNLIVANHELQVKDDLAVLEHPRQNVVGSQELRLFEILLANVPELLPEPHKSRSLTILHLPH